MDKRYGIVMGLGALLMVPGLVGAASPGTSGATVLNIPVGARAIGMGEAYTAQADDVSSLYWNPAGIAILNQSQASFMYNQALKDLTFHNAAVAVPLENGGLGASLSYLSYGQIEGFDAMGNAAGDVNAYSGVATLGAAWLGSFWSAGMNLKGVQESLADVKANGFATDMGVNVVYPEEIKGGTLRAAAVLRNVGTGLKFIDQTDPFPRQWRVGLAAVQMMQRRLNLSVDYGLERNSDGALYAGSEYWLLPYIALRAGYAGSHAEGNGMRAGIGLRLKNIAFDYAFSEYGDLGLSHRYELSMRFGTLHPRLTPEERKLLRRAKLAMAQERYGEATMLLDALIKLVPDYRPVRRMITTAMGGYEKQERVLEKKTDFKYHQALRATPKAEDVSELRDLESLLMMSDEALARSGEKKPGTSSAGGDKR